MVKVENATRSVRDAARELGRIRRDRKGSGVTPARSSRGAAQSATLYTKKKDTHGRYALWCCLLV